MRIRVPSLKGRKPKSWLIHNEVYSYTLCLRLDDDLRRGTAWVNRKLGTDFEPHGEYVLGRTFMEEGNADNAILFLGLPGSSTIAHEAFHSVKHVMFHRGMRKLTGSNEEAYAYLLGWTVRQINERLYP